LHTYLLLLSLQKETNGAAHSTSPQSMLEVGLLFLVFGVAFLWAGDRPAYLKRYERSGFVYFVSRWFAPLAFILFGAVASIVGLVRLL
jgi:hypothetical protein